MKICSGRASGAVTEVCHVFECHSADVPQIEPIGRQHLPEHVPLGISRLLFRGAAAGHPRRCPRRQGVSIFSSERFSTGWRDAIVSKPMRWPASRERFDLISRNTPAASVDRRRGSLQACAGRMLIGTVDAVHRDVGKNHVVQERAVDRVESDAAQERGPDLAFADADVVRSRRSTPCRALMALHRVWSLQPVT